MDGQYSLKGMYDLHVHASPSVVKRKFSAPEALKLAGDEDMGGFMLLDHMYNTAPIAHVLNESGHKTRVFGSILLNESVGGPDPMVVESAILLGTKQIQLPTYSSRNHKEKYGDDQSIFPYQKKATGYYLLDNDGRLIPELEDILMVMKDSDSFLGTGHLSMKEIQAVVARAKELQIPVMVTSVSTDIIDLPIEIQKLLSDEHIFMEHDYAVLTDIVHKKTPIENVVEQIRSVGADHCILATDSGQQVNPDLVVCFKNFIEKLMSCGITENEVELMTIKNPKILLNIK
ncbi:DUF6282 family protein [Thermodesulfobacteriota bacterium]